LTDISSTEFQKQNDGHLVQAALGGDASAFDHLVHRYTGMVYSLGLVRLGHDAGSAEELTQEVFLRAWLHLDRLSQPEAFPAWLAQITRNLAADWVRRERRTSGLVQMLSIDDNKLKLPDAAAPGPRDSASTSEARQQVLTALRKMPVEDQELIMLHYGEDLSQSEIARQLNVKPSTIMRRLQRAMVRLRELYHGEPSLALIGQAHDRMAKRTCIVLAAAWSLTAAQRSALAAVAEKALPVPVLPPAGGSFFSTTGGKIMSVTGAAAVALIALALGTSRQMPMNGAGGTEFNGSKPDSRLVQIKGIEDGRGSKLRSSIHAQPRVTEESTAPGSARRLARANSSTTVTSTSQKAETTSAVVAEQKQFPGRVSGQVVDENGAPVPGVAVNVSALTFAQHVISSSLSQGSKAMVASQPVQQTGRKYTDDLGNFLIKYPTTGTAVIFTDHAPYVRTMQKVDLPSENLRIVLSTQGGAIADGMVRNIETGEPVGNADVTVALQAPVEWFSGDKFGTRTLSILGDYVKLKADKDGRYSIDRMPAAEVRVYAWSAALGPDVPVELLGEEKSSLKAGTTTNLPPVFLFPGYTLRGYVRDAESGEPVAGAKVGPMSGPTHMAGENTKEVVSDENGFYEITGMRAYYGKAHGDEPERISSELISVEKDGYRRNSHMPRIDGKFDPKNLILNHDFRIIPLKEGESKSLNVMDQIRAYQEQTGAKKRN